MGSSDPRLREEMADSAPASSAGAPTDQTAASKTVIDDIFGASDDEDEDFYASNGAAVTAPAASKATSEDDIFASDSEDEPEVSTASRLKKGKDSSSKKKEKKKKEKKEKEGKRRKRDEDDEARRERRAIKKARRASDVGESLASKTGGEGDSGDEYDSDAEPVRTAEDDAFLDTQDDDRDMLNDYYNQEQNFNDERPDGLKMGKGHMEDADGRTFRNPMDRTIQAMKKKKKAELSETQKENLTMQLLEEMIVAAKNDDELFRANKPAVQKLALLPRVTDVLNVRDLQNTLLERNVLDVFSTWIEPRDKHTLCSHNVRTTIYSLLSKLPCQVDHLRRSGIGKTVLALRKHKMETTENKRTLQKLIEKWSRFIFGKSADTRGVASDESQAAMHEALAERRRQQRAEDLEQAERQQVQQAKKDFIADAQGRAAGDGTRQRIRVPMNFGKMFSIRPESKVDRESAQEAVVTSATKSTMRKRMKEMKLAMGVKDHRAEQPSVSMKHKPNVG